MIDLKALNFRYRKDKEVLKDLNVTFSEGKITSILGRNGSGKSTMLKNINRIIKPDSGKIIIDGKSVQEYSRKELAKLVGFLAQRSSGIDATVMDAVLTGRRPHMGMDISRYDREVSEKVLKMMGLEKFACRRTTEISGGELQKVVIARALVQEPRILLLDEPVNHLDVVNQLEVLGFIRDVTIDKEMTTVIVMHDINTAIRFSDELVFMKDGSIVRQCKSYEIDADLVKESFGLSVEITTVNDMPFVIPL
jgi:iron complex transport system ATP-binding protein